MTNPDKPTEQSELRPIVKEALAFREGATVREWVEFYEEAKETESTLATERDKFGKRETERPGTGEEAMKIVQHKWPVSFELRVHFKKGRWYRLCINHLKPLNKKKIGWTENPIRSEEGCDIPWCKLKLTYEVHPTKNSIVSFFNLKKNP